MRASDHARPIMFGDRGELGGFEMGQGDQWVVLAHQSNGDSCQMLPIARALADNGFHPLAIDFSGGGASYQSNDPDRPLAADIVDAVAYAERSGATTIAALGASMGGYAVLGATKPLEKRLDAVVSLSAPDYYSDGGSSPDLRGVETPVLLYVGRSDISFLSPNQHFAEIDSAAELHVLPTSDHGVHLVDASVLREITAFLHG